MRTLDWQKDGVPECSGDTLSIVSWNLLAPSLDRSGLDWTLVRLPAFTHWVHRFAAADIVCFQEVDLACGALEDVQRVMTPLGFDALVQEKGAPSFVNATFFKRSRFKLSWAEPRSRALLAGLVMADGRELGVANVHLQAGPGHGEEKQRVSQTTSALRKLRERASWCEVVCGDFNSPLDCDSPIAEALSEAGLSGAPGKGPTYIVKGYADALDHIWAGQAMKPQAVLASCSRDVRALRKAGLPDERHPSDHLPVAAVFRLLAGAVCRASLQPPASVSEDVREEWLEVLLCAPALGSGKRAVSEHRQLEKAFLGALTTEQAEEVQTWSTAAAAAAAVMVKIAAARAVQAADKKGSGKDPALDPASSRSCFGGG